MTERYDVAIVGGGISGLALAWELRRYDVGSILILDKSYSGSGASGRNVGRVRAMQLTPSLARLAAAAQHKHARLSDELGMNTLFWRAGYAWVLYEEEELERMASVAAMLSSLGIGSKLYDAAGASGRLPVLAGGERPAGALIRSADAIVHHDALIYAFRRRLRERGIDLLEGHEVIDVQREGGRIDGVAARHRGRELRFEVPIVVNATEGWSREVSAMVGLAVPNRRVRHEVFVTEPAKPFMREAITFYRPVEGWFNQTLRGEMVAGVSDPDEPEGLEHRSTFSFLRRTASVVLKKAPRVGHLRVIRQWAGVYDVTPDRLPIVGSVASVPGFFQANGYSGRGMALAPILAEYLASLIVHGERHEFLEWCDPNRFEGTTDWSVAGDYYSGYATTQEAAAHEGGGARG